MVTLDPILAGIASGIVSVLLPSVVDWIQEYRSEDIEGGMEVIEW